MLTKRIWIIAVASIALLCGCATKHFVIGHGDVGLFILQQTERVGAVPRKSVGLPKISDYWRYEMSDDELAMNIYLSRDAYPAVEAFLLEAFGPPRLGPIVADDGKSGAGVYRLTPTGGGLLFRYDDEHTVVLVVSRQRKLIAEGDTWKHRNRVDPFQSAGKDRSVK